MNADQHPVAIDLDDPLQAGRQFAAGIVLPMMRELIDRGAFDHKGSAQFFAGFLAPVLGAMSAQVGPTDADVVIGKLRDAMDLAYLSGQRPADVLRLSWTDVREGVIALRQGKTGAALRIEVTPAVQSVLDRIAARQREARISDLADLAIVQDADGRRMSAGALRGAFDRARAAAAAAEPVLVAQIKAFQFRDLRANAGTDQAERSGLLAARRQLGHSSVAMTEQYVRMGPRVKPTR